MGLVISKSELEHEGATSKDLIVGGVPNSLRNKRNSRTSHSSHRRGGFDDCFGLDESQSRSTESTQGSPEIDMYPSKSTREARRSSFGPSSGRPKWFRRPSSGSGFATHNDTASYNSKSIKPHPPSYLICKDSVENIHQSLPTLNSQSSSGKTAPVPVKTRKSKSMDTMGGWGEPYEEGYGGDSEAQIDELQRMYDMRTWDMYIRITEARKNRPTPSMIPHHQQVKPSRAEEDDYDYYSPRDDSSFDDPNLLLDESQSEEMIFGDLE